MLDFDASKIRLLVLDSDGVTVPRGTKIVEDDTGTYSNQYILTYKIKNELAWKINQLRKKMPVCISSGRSLTFLLNMYDKIIGKNAMFMAENGNFIFAEGMLQQPYFYPDYYYEQLRDIKQRIKDLHNKDIRGFEPKISILTVHATKRVPDVYKIVKYYESMRVMWNGEAFDIQNEFMSKGKGLEHLRGELGVYKENVVAVGDRINDREMLQQAGISISTDKKNLKADYYIKDAIEIIDYLRGKP